LRKFSQGFALAAVPADFNLQEAEEISFSVASTPRGSARRREFRQEEPSLNQYQFSLDRIAGRVYDHFEDQLFRRYLDQYTSYFLPMAWKSKPDEGATAAESGYWKKP